MAKVIDVDVCPKCGAGVIHGYGLMGGGMGPWVICETDSCTFFMKEQDLEGMDEEGAV